MVSPMNSQVLCPWDSKAKNIPIGDKSLSFKNCANLNASKWKLMKAIYV